MPFMRNATDSNRSKLVSPRPIRHPAGQRRGSLCRAWRCQHAQDGKLIVTIPGPETG